MKNNDRMIITLTGENGTTLDFYYDAELEYDGEMYAIMHPVNSNLGLDPDEAIVFRIENSNGEMNIELEYNDDIINAVQDIYNNSK